MDSNKLNQHLTDVKSQLDSVGCGFCLKKWTQVTMQLTDWIYTFITTSTHPIPQREIKKKSITSQYSI